MCSTDASTTLLAGMFINADFKLNFKNIKAPGLRRIWQHACGITSGPLNVTIGKFKSKYIAKEYYKKERLRKARATQSKYKKMLSANSSFLRSNNGPIFPMKRRAYVFVNNEAETHAPAVDVIKLIVASHPSAVKSLEMRALLEGDTTKCHELTPLFKKQCLSYSLLKDTQQSITATSCALMPAASQEYRHVTSFVSTLVHVVGDALVDTDKQSITILSGVSAFASVASGEQDHASSGALALA